VVIGYHFQHRLMRKVAAMRKSLFNFLTGCEDSVVMSCSEKIMMENPSETLTYSRRKDIPCLFLVPDDCHLAITIPVASPCEDERLLRDERIY
jgi:hypothetical protein